MKKLFGAVVGAVALMASGLASAAPVDIVLQPGTGEITVRVDPGIDVGYISFGITGATTFVLGPNPPTNVSTADSVIDLVGGFIILASPAGVPMLPSGGPPTLLATTDATSIVEDFENLGDAVLDVDGVTVASIVRVPEPATLALLGLGLAGLALVRRTA